LNRFILEARGALEFVLVEEPCEATYIAHLLHDLAEVFTQYARR